MLLTAINDYNNNKITFAQLRQTASKVDSRFSTWIVKTYADYDAFITACKQIVWKFYT